MTLDLDIFYLTYQTKYHEIKADYLKKMLDTLSSDSESFFGEKLDIDSTEQIRLALKSDLRQTYFHAMETFFELFFALNPKSKNRISDESKILWTLTNSNWNNNFKEIKKIALDENALDYLDNEIIVFGKNTTIGRHLFYSYIYESNRMNKNFFEDINESIEAIKYGMKILASDFIKREEYNAYKHGLRIIPAVNSLMFANANTLEIKAELGLKDSMFFFVKDKISNEIKAVTKLFDVERDIKMIYLCSNLIHHLIFFRRIARGFKEDMGKFEKMPIYIFGKKEIEESSKVNVPVQNLIYPIKKL